MKSIPFEETTLFRLLAPARDSIRPYLRRQRFREGEYLYFDSDRALHVWTVSSGEVRTLRAGSSGRITTLESLGPGDLFGLAAIREHVRYGESAQAQSEGDAWRLPRHVVSRVLESDPHLGRAVLEIVASRLQSAHDRLCSFAQNSVSERMARTLLEAVDGDRVEATRRSLGEAAGTTVETAIRVLRRFEREGWTQGGIGWVRVLDRAALARLAEGRAHPPS
ncbi:MAG: Crp/Fnr family transcriptional regulator [Myxococcota bacterium]